MKYLLEDYKEDLKAMQAMVRKLYPAFDDRRDFCLWLVPEYFDDAPSYRYYCPDVTLTDRSGRTICPLPEKAALTARYPYPNKCLFQTGVRYGAQICFKGEQRICQKMYFFHTKLPLYLGILLL